MRHTVLRSSHKTPILPTLKSLSVRLLLKCIASQPSKVCKSNLEHYQHANASTPEFETSVGVGTWKWILPGGTSRRPQAWD